MFSTSLGRDVASSCGVDLSLNLGKRPEETIAKEPSIAAGDEDPQN